jgi:predicted acylesterase/phospholipase RssA
LPGGNVQPIINISSYTNIYMGNRLSGNDSTDQHNTNQSNRITELEAEIERLRNKYESTNPDLDSVLKAKEKLDYEYIVFSGGGTKGVSYCGALEILSKLNVIGSNIKGFAGTSAGSMMAGLLAVGYTTAELTDLMLELNFEDFVDGQTSYIREGLNLIETYGLVPGKFLHEFLGKLIEKKTGSADYTIQQLYDDKKIKLVIVCTDMNLSRSRYFYPDSPVEADRNIPIRQAIRMSAGIPFMFEPIIHDSNYHVDGGMLDNYPIHVFDGAYPGDINAKNNITKPNSKVLGFHVSSEETYDPSSILTGGEKDGRIKINSFLHYGSSFINAFMNENERRAITEANELRTIKIVTPYISLTTFAMTLEQKQSLIELGKTATSKFFLTHLEK